MRVTYILAERLLKRRASHVPTGCAPKDGSRAERNQGSEGKPMSEQDRQLSRIESPVPVFSS